jgi:hypothetical protein
MMKNSVFQPRNRNITPHKPVLTVGSDRREFFINDINYDGSPSEWASPNCDLTIAKWYADSKGERFAIFNHKGQLVRHKKCVSRKPSPRFFRTLGQAAMAIHMLSDIPA